jgi:peptidoglycan/LPS O-acetylase OafA/YrhL
MVTCKSDLAQGGSRSMQHANRRTDSGFAQPPAIQAGWGRVPELDALRALAAIAVMTYHLRSYWLPRAWVAVDLFFVLSGYFITSIALKYGENTGFLWTFYLRRALRILPVYLLTLLALSVLSPWLPQRCHFAGLPYHLVYMHTINRYGLVAIPEFSPYLLHTWTIAIEEQFYLVWPILLLFARRGQALLLGAAVATISVVARSGGIHWWTTLGRLDALALGGILAALLADRQCVLERIQQYRTGFCAAAGAGLATLILAAYGGGFPIEGPPKWPAMTVLASSVMWFGVVGLVVTHAGHPLLAFLRRPRLCFLGQMSYSLYLYHYVVFWIMRDYLYSVGIRGRSLAGDAASVLFVIGLSLLSFRYIELPLLRFKDRFHYGGPSSHNPSSSFLRRPRARIQILRAASALTPRRWPISANVSRSR